MSASQINDQVSFGATPWIGEISADITSRNAELIEGRDQFHSEPRFESGMPTTNEISRPQGTDVIPERFSQSSDINEIH